MMGDGEDVRFDWRRGGAAAAGLVAALFLVGMVFLVKFTNDSRERALAALASEIRIMLDEGLVAAPQDVDLCLILGAGWPFHLGGVTPFLDRSGVSERVTGARFLPTGVASVPA